MIYRGGWVYHNKTLTQQDVEVSDGIITAVAPHIEGAEVTDCAGLLLAPMMADVHTHGCLNIDFTEAETADLARMADYYKSTGVGTFLPTLISSPREAYFEIRKRLPGVRLRLEGPFFGVGKKGAHEASCLTLPDRELLEQIGLEQIAMVDVDPAQPGAVELIEWLERQGIRTSVAHTEATSAQTMAAFDRGCRHVTHLFNAMNGLHHRESGVLGAACATFGVVLPSFVIIFLLSFVLRQFQQIQAVKYAFNGIRAGVLALLVKSLWTMFKKVPKGWVSYVVICGALLVTALMKVNIFLVILGCAVFGLVTALLADRRAKK